MKQFMRNTRLQIILQSLGLSIDFCFKAKFVQLKNIIFPFLSVQDTLNQGWSYFSIRYILHLAIERQCPSNLPPAPPPQGQTGVIKLNFMYFAVYLQNYCLKSCKSSLNYSSELFKPNDMAILAFQGQFLLICQRFHFRSG